MPKQTYSELAVNVDLISHQYKTSNPIVIAEKIEEDLGIEYSIYQIADYLNINKMEDYEQESNKIKHYQL